MEIDGGKLFETLAGASVASIVAYKVLDGLFSLLTLWVKGQQTSQSEDSETQNSILGLLKDVVSRLDTSVVALTGVVAIMNDNNPKIGEKLDEVSSKTDKVLSELDSLKEVIKRLIPEGAEKGDEPTTPVKDDE